MLNANVAVTMGHGHAHKSIDSLHGKIEANRGLQSCVSYAFELTNRGHAECAWAATAQKTQPFSTSAVREARVGKSNLNIATYGLVLDSFWTRLDVLLLHALKAAARTLFYTFLLQHSVSF